MFNPLVNLLIICWLFATFEATPMIDSGTFQVTHSTLSSINERLQNLENTLVVQFTAAIATKIDYYGRKIDDMEKNLSKFQVYVQIELDKIFENVSSNNFKNDRIARKMDTIYEKINRKLANIEDQIDLVNVKSQNIEEIVTTKLDKMEENLTIRDTDMEAELADVVAVIDDLKITCTNIEENILNATRKSTQALHNHGNLTANYNREAAAVLNSTFERVIDLHETMIAIINQTEENSGIIMLAKNEMEENLNEYANKLVDMHWELWKNTDKMHNKLQSLSKIMNLTRNEQQNGFRALTVQVGRRTGKSVYNECHADNEKLEELNQKIQTSFENILSTQNMFLESCYRVQMDEAQLESQISVVLNKAVDVFEQKTSLGPEDLYDVLNVITTHDKIVERYYNSIIGALDRTYNYNTKGSRQLFKKVDDNKQLLNTVYLLLKDVVAFQGRSMHVMQFKIDQLTAIGDERQLEFLTNIFDVLKIMEMKIDKLLVGAYFDKYNVDASAHRFGKQTRANNTNVAVEKTNNPFPTSDENMTKIILEIFSKNDNYYDQKTVDPYDDYPYVITTLTGDNATDCLPYYADLIDVRSNSNTTNKPICVVSTTKATTDEIDDEKKPAETPKGCLPNYDNLIDVRSNSDSNCITPTTTTVSPNKTEEPVNYEDLIDVRRNSGDTKSSDRNTTSVPPNDSKTVDPDESKTDNVEDQTANATTTETPVN